MTKTMMISYLYIVDKSGGVWRLVCNNVLMYTYIYLV